MPAKTYNFVVQESQTETGEYDHDSQSLDITKLPLNSEEQIANDLLNNNDDTLLGQIVRVDRKNELIWISCPEKSDKEIPTRLGSLYITLEDILNSNQRISLAVVDFNAPGKWPIIRDVYCSLNESRKTQTSELEGRKIHIKADEIVLEGKQQVTIKSGDTQTMFKAKGGKLIQLANKIRSVAKQENKIQGGAVRIN